MQWNKKDIEQYIEVKEYVDTLVIPLTPFTLNADKEMVKQASQAELMEIYAKEIERQFTGRILLLPNYTYQTVNETEEKRLNEWINYSEDNPFKHVFFITFDHQWKKVEKGIEGNLIWLPTISISEIGSQDSVKLIKEQVEQVTELIKSYW
ncbi:DUF2487 family protein [Aquibacillus kalidii]|uniref:DUF2487 family protein n=1 Tax=Aquibacillus kalidii TaxID=2762597 RepID=UPI001645BD4B|nr:DUF2487 family protein [Aquibacillus kalidii]